MGAFSSCHSGGRELQLRTVHTICQMCYHFCGLTVTVDGNRIVRVDGTKEHPVNRGTICPKGLASQQLVTDPKRLKFPLLRDGPRGSDRWKRITWDEAFLRAGDNLEKTIAVHGPESIAYERGTAPGLVTTSGYGFRFMHSLGSPNVAGHNHLCMIPRAMAHSATYGGVPEADYDHARCIVLWGYNPVYNSLPNYARRVIEAKRRRSKLIVIDPRFTMSAAKADLWLQPFLGTDLVLAMGLSKVIIEEELYDRDFVEQHTVGFSELRDYLSGWRLEQISAITKVREEQIQIAARMMAQNSPCAIKEGNGLEHQLNVTQSVRAIALLPVLCGSLNIEGGNVLIPPLPSVDLEGRKPLPPDWHERSIATRRMPVGIGNPAPVHDQELFHTLETGKPYPIKALIVEGGALVARNAYTDRIRNLLNRLDFLVVHDLYLTATAEMADLVLPAASFLEREHLLYYRYRPSAQVNMVGLQRQVVRPVGESRTDIDFIFGLAKTMGLKEAFPWDSADEAFNWQLGPLGISTEYLREHPEGYIRRYSSRELYRTHGRSEFATRSRKAELYASLLEENGYAPIPQIEPLDPSVVPTEEYPLLCMASLKLGIHTHTQFRTLPWIKSLEPDPFVEIHPGRARKMGIHPGDRVDIVTPRGRIPVRARFSEGIDESCVAVTYGYGQPYAGDGWKSCNDITPFQESDPISGATSNRRFPCRIERAEPTDQEAETDTFALVVNTTRCVGCHTCELACLQEHGQKRIRVHTIGPKQTQKPVLEAFVDMLDSCDLCAERARKGEEPACVSACPTNALEIVTVEDLIPLIHSVEHHICGIRDLVDHRRKE